MTSTTNAYIFTRSDHTGNCFAATLLPAPGYRYQPNITCILREQDLGFSEPVIDRSHWQQGNILKRSEISSPTITCQYLSLNQCNNVLECRTTLSGPLTLLLQHNEQPNHDIGHQQTQNPVALFDLRFD